MQRLPSEERKIEACLKEATRTTIVHYFDQVPSTMDVAFSLGASPRGASSLGAHSRGLYSTVDGEGGSRSHPSHRVPAVVIADRQTEGRGRLGRVWHSPPGSVSLSLLLTGFDYRVPYSMIASLAVYRTFKRIEERLAPGHGEPAAGAGVRLKWINDVLWSNGKKVAGILTEERMGMTVIGIGVNLNCTRTRMPPNIAAGATSFLIERGVEVERVEFICLLIRSLLHLLQRLENQGISVLLAEWEEAARMGHRKVRVVGEHGSMCRGTVQGIDRRSGALILTDELGNRREIYEGTLYEE